MMTFGQRLLKAIENSGLDQKQLSEKTGITAATISRYCTDKMGASGENIKLIAKVLNVSTDYLLGNEKAETSDSLSEKDEKDIAKTMSKLREQLANEQGLMFDGEILDEETAKLLLEAIEQQEKMIKKINKKYTPNKYKK